MHGDEKYINHLPYRCSGLKRNSFLHETSPNSYCDLDIISVIDASLGMRLGSCPLGPLPGRIPAVRDSMTSNCSALFPDLEFADQE